MFIYIYICISLARNRDGADDAEFLAAALCFTRRVTLGCSKESSGATCKLVNEITHTSPKFNSEFAPEKWWDWKTRQAFPIGFS